MEKGNYIDFAADKAAMERLADLRGQVEAMSKDGYMVGDIVQEFLKMEERMKMRMRWSGVYRITDGTSEDLQFEGTPTECTDYVMEHPELKGHCIICPLA